MPRWLYFGGFNINGLCLSGFGLGGLALGGLSHGGLGCLGLGGFRRFGLGGFGCLGLGGLRYLGLSGLDCLGLGGLVGRSLLVQSTFSCRAGICAGCGWPRARGCAFPRARALGLPLESFYNKLVYTPDWPVRCELQVYRVTSYTVVKVWCSDAPLLHRC